MTRHSKYPFEELEIGDFFVVPFKYVREASLQTYCGQVGRRLGRKFVTTVLASGDMKVMRVAQTPIFNVTRQVADATEDAILSAKGLK